MRRIVIAGARHRGWLKGRPVKEQIGSGEDREFLQSFIIRKMNEFSDDVLIVSMGADAGFGRGVRLVCGNVGAPFVEVKTAPSQKVPSHVFELLHMARHGALMDIGEEFHVFVLENRVANIEDLVQRLQLYPGRNVPEYYIYDESRRVIDSSETEKTRRVSNAGRSKS